jgi:hypothetical protein
MEKSQPKIGIYDLQTSTILNMITTGPQFVKANFTSMHIVLPELYLLNSDIGITLLDLGASPSTQQFIVKKTVGVTHEYFRILGHYLQGEDKIAIIYEVSTGHIK